ncbi:MAG: hypothetical protein EHM48_09015, partial [Planctomycetaceae bacterium]
MTDIPQMYLDEAIRRLENDCPYLSWDGSVAVPVLAHTLQELGWKPPIDEARMAKARKVAAAVFKAAGFITTADNIETGMDSYEY